MPIDTSVDLRDAAAVCDLFERATEANRDTPGRTGSVVDLPARGVAMLTGDLHDRPDQYQRILRLAKLHGSTHHHVIFQEVIHGEHLVNGNDFSYRQLAAIAQLKADRPAQVHQVLSNHELSQVTGEGILKDGVSVVEAFENGLSFVFGDDGAKVLEALCAYVRSMPLAIRCANGVFCCHSLPSAYHKEKFDPKVLDRTLTDADIEGPTGSAHIMVWGRGLAQTVADELAAAWNTRLFVMGHQHVEMGWETFGQTMLVLNSDHAHGVALPVDLAREYSRNDLCDEVLPLNGVIL